MIYPTPGLDGFIAPGELDYSDMQAAAQSDIGAAVVEAYQLGVEDSKTLSILETDDYVTYARWAILRRNEATLPHDKEYQERAALYHMFNAMDQFDEAFRGAKNMDRVEIRQRLLKLKEGSK